MKEFWNERYAQKEYVYGTAPNDFFRQKLADLNTGKILLSAEGEGRNAVYAAKSGWNVTAFDISEQGKHKAQKLALENKVSIRYDIASVTSLDYPDEYFDCIGVFFMHLPPEIKNIGYSELMKKLKPGGTVILEVFSKNQLNYNSGGPANVDMLFNIQELNQIFKGFTIVNFQENEVVLNEGPFHQGKAATIKGTAVK